MISRTSLEVTHSSHSFNIHVYYNSLSYHVVEGLSSCDQWNVHLDENHQEMANSFYKINADGNTYTVYCDMESGRGGWMLALNSVLK